MSRAADRPLVPAPPTADPVHMRRAENNERFIAFAFAGAEMVVETDASGIITYAAGAFQSKSARPKRSSVMQ